VLKKGSKFAFTLFSQPSFWKFDWSSGRAIRNGKEESQLNLGRVPTIETLLTNAHVSSPLTPVEIVIWPMLVRVMDGEGVKLFSQGEEEGDGIHFGRKKYLDDFGKAS
jgi:hypothetical protein